MFGKKQSEWMLTRKAWDHAIDVKEGFIPRKGKVYPLSREKREEVREFVKEQLRKDIFSHRSHRKWYWYSLWGRKMGRNKWCKITGISMSEQLRTTIHSH